MTEADKKIVKKMIKDVVKEMDDSMRYLDQVLGMIRTEMKAIGHDYGQWVCKCGKARAPFYRAPLRFMGIVCTCGRQMTFKDLT